MNITHLITLNILQNTQKQCYDDQPMFIYNGPGVLPKKLHADKNTKWDSYKASPFQVFAIFAAVG